MTRKDFINRLSTILGAITLPSASFAASSSSVDSRKKAKELAKMNKTRHIARWRSRRIICNNDGNDIILSSGETVSRELFLAKRTMGLVGSQVDTISYCTGITFGGSQKGKSRHFQKRLGMTRCVNELDAMGTDPLRLMVDFCHQHNIEIFWSHRMNDRHDETPTPALVTDFKKEHPEYLMTCRKGIMAYNYAVEAVRNKFLECCAEVVENYDVDGIELDYFRHLRLFESVVSGGVASDEEREMINDMMRKLRGILDKEGIRRGRPVLLSVRVPDSRDYARLAGIDYEQWLKEDIVDLLIVNDYIKLEPWKNFPEFAKQYDVPAYACLENRRLSLMDSDLGAKPEGLGNAVNERFRSEAYAAWLSGMNGIYTYNRFNPHDELFRQIGDPFVLAQMKVIPRESYGLTESVKGLAYCNVKAWLKCGDKFMKKPAEHMYARPSTRIGWPDSQVPADENP